ncbi:MAG: hypothetical protein ABS76_12285 [Pelagibacterium sp. SCN 64-44]|nr:MAG: hypothetical protein ABS76_12285 [Pelagibacterium sp. SCN 64-44]
MTGPMPSANDPSQPVHKGFVTVDGLPVHYIRQGRGPAVVMLHASPCSAKVMAPLQAVWGREFTTFAFDLPGFGLSQAPTDGEVTIERLADIIAGAMRALGIEQAALYGRHTGASVALELALRHPDLAAMLLTDGLPVFAAPYSEQRLAEYLPPIVPQWDGGHLTWTFFRYREQHMFWPWDAADLAHRADADLPDADFIHRGTLELLEAAGTYARTYRAAFLHQALPRIGAVAMPAYWGNRPGDSQFKTIARYPENAPVHVMARDPDIALHEELELLRRHPARGAVPEHRSTFAVRPRPAEILDYIETRHGPVRALARGLDKAARPVLFLHDLPGSFELHEAMIGALAEAGPVLAFELGGNAESPLRRPPDQSIWMEQAEDVLAAMEWSGVNLVAHGTAAALALELAAGRPGLVNTVRLQSPPMLEADERARLARACPDIAPTEDGGYLLRLWHHLRDRELWSPWYRKDHAARRGNEPRIDPAWLTKQAVALLKQPRNHLPIWHDVLSRDVAALVADSPVPVLITYAEDDLFGPAARHYLVGRDGAAKTDSTPNT